MLQPARELRARARNASRRGWGAGGATYTPLPKERLLSPCASWCGLPASRVRGVGQLSRSVAGNRRPRAWARAFVRACIRGGRVRPLKCLACRYVDGLKDDGQYMVPETPDDISSGNALFDFGSAHGTPLSKTTGEPVRPRGSYTPLFTHSYMPICACACVCVRVRACACVCVRVAETILLSHARVLWRRSQDICPWIIGRGRAQRRSISPTKSTSLISKVSEGFFFSF
jgi:hypothetical protein